jgi:hypothetical protein
MSKSKWNYSGDVNMLDYGGKNIRCIGDRRYQIVELINMDDACGRDNEGQPKYNVSLSFVNLDALTEANIKSAKNCSGVTEDCPDSMLAELCHSYGCIAPMGNWNGNNARKLLRQAYAEANSLCDDAELVLALQKPVNAIGSTALEFMRGDIFSPIQRGCESGSPDARIMAKMYGVPQETIDDVRPDDWLPFLMGYMAGINGGAKETDPDTAPEYFRGYERGENVKAGKCPAPSWIATAKGAQ